MTVLLPAPLGPSRPKISPLLIEREIPLTASNFPYRLIKFCTVTSASLVCSALRGFCVRIASYTTFAPSIGAIMSHPKLLGQKFQNREGRGQSLLPGRGMSPQKLFFLFLRAACGSTRRERSRGHPCNPVKGPAALCN